MATLKELADIVQGTVVGDPTLKIKGVSTIQDGKPESITFVAHPKYFKFVQSTEASAVITSDIKKLKNKDGIIVENPQMAMAKVLGHFSPKAPPQKGIHETAIIDPDAKVGKNVSIGPYTIIEKGVILGDNVILGANNVINTNSAIGHDSMIKSNVHFYPQTKIGERCIIHSGTVLGSDGYGYVIQKDVHLKIPQNGKVLIGNDVEIGANCTIDRGTIDNTIVGSTKVGEFCLFGGQAGAIDHITIGDRAVFACYTVAMKDLRGGKIYSGVPAREIKAKNRQDAVYIEVKQLKKRLNLLEEKFKVIS